MSIDGRFQQSRQLFADEQRHEQAKNAGAPAKPAEDEHENEDPDQERPPDLHVAQARHEQIQHRIRPAFIDEIKKTLIHVRPEAAASF